MYPRPKLFNYQGLRKVNNELNELSVPEAVSYLSLLYYIWDFAYRKHLNFNPMKRRQLSSF